MKSEKRSLGKQTAVGAGTLEGQGREGRSLSETAGLPAARELFQQLEKRLWQEVVRKAGEPQTVTFLQHAAREAAAMAWMTPFPLLFYPLLLQEKTQEAETLMQKQREVSEKSQWIVSLAV